MGFSKRFDDQICELILHGVIPSIWVILQEVGDVQSDALECNKRCLVYERISKHGIFHRKCFLFSEKHFFSDDTLSCKKYVINTW